MPAKKNVLKVISILSIASCNLSGDSVNTVIKEIPNPNHNKKAILFMKESGATVGDSYQLTISDFEYPLKKTEVGNTFTVDENHGSSRLDSSSVVILWLSNDSLKVSYDKNLRTFIQESNVNGVNIFYEAR